MAASDELAKLAIRAKQAEEHVAAARAKQKADLEQEVEAARASSQTRARMRGAISITVVLMPSSAAEAATSRPINPPPTGRFCTNCRLARSGASRAQAAIR